MDTIHEMIMMMRAAGSRWGDQQGPGSQFGRNRSGVVRQCKQKSSSEIVNRSGDYNAWHNQFLDRIPL